MDHSEVEQPTQYEVIIQKLEGDIRQHIRLEQQLKLHIDSINDKFEQKQQEIDLLQEQNKKLADQVDRLEAEVKSLKAQMKQSPSCLQTNAGSHQYTRTTIGDPYGYGS